MITLAVSMLSDTDLEKLYAELRVNLINDRLDTGAAGLWSKAILNEKDDRNLKWTI